jgi:hypothetical protein
MENAGNIPEGGDGCALQEFPVGIALVRDAFRPAPAPYQVDDRIDADAGAGKIVLQLLHLGQAGEVAHEWGNAVARLRRRFLDAGPV